MGEIEVTMPDGMESWFAADIDSSAWKKGKSPFGQYMGKLPTQPIHKCNAGCTGPGCYGATPIATLAATGGDLAHTFADSTGLPAGATHLLVFSANPDGEMGTGVSTAIVDLGVPVNAAVSVAFTDTDLDGGELAGDVTITRAAG